MSPWPFPETRHDTGSATVASTLTSGAPLLAQVLEALPTRYNIHMTGETAHYSIALGVLALFFEFFVSWVPTPPFFFHPPPRLHTYCRGFDGLDCIYGAWRTAGCIYG